MAVKAMQKGKIADYQSFKNEINILMQLVGTPCIPLLMTSSGALLILFCLNSIIYVFRTTQI